MAGPFDIVCVLHNEKNGTFSAAHFVELSGWEDPKRANVQLRGFAEISASRSYETALETMKKLAAHFGIRPENIILDVVFPVTQGEPSLITWTIPNWRSPARPFTKVFPGRPPPRPTNGWGQLLNDDFDL